MVWPASICSEHEPERLQRIASYGLAEDVRPRRIRFDPGEGLVGQCASERQPITLTNLPPGYLEISSGLGQAAPIQAIAWPVVSHDTLLGVLEVASFRPSLPASRRCWKNCCPSSR